MRFEGGLLGCGLGLLGWGWGWGWGWGIGELGDWGKGRREGGEV